MSQTTTIKPIKTFDLHLMWVPGMYDDLHSQDPRELPPSTTNRADNPIVVAYQTNEWISFRQPSEVSYYLTLDPAPPSSLQLAPSVATIAVHGPNNNKTPNHGHEGCVESAKIYQPWFIADASCTVCSINAALIPETISSPPRAFSSGPHADIYCGSRHGEWYDYKLTQLLGTACTNVEPQPHKDKHLKWVAGTEAWDPVYWEGRGKIVGGHLKLRMHGEEEVLAVYKSRAATWLQRIYYQGINGPWEDWEDGGGAYTSSLGILKKGVVTKEVVRHMLMACVAIEEQILRNKGFEGAYHGGWL